MPKSCHVIWSTLGESPDIVGPSPLSAVKLSALDAARRRLMGLSYHCHMLDILESSAPVLN